MRTERPQRIQCRRTAGWRLPATARFCGRPSRWGNPWVVGEEIEVRVMGVQVGAGAGLFRANDHRHYDRRIPPLRMTAELAVHLFRTDLEDSLARAERGDPEFQELARELAKLRGLDLACWCPLTQPDGTTAPCHVDVLLEVANR